MYPDVLTLQRTPHLKEKIYFNQAHYINLLLCRHARQVYIEKYFILIRINNLLMED